MILPILKYGHPILRQKGARIERITPEVVKLIDDMLETMHAASGIGLAAQQVGYALQLTVLDLRGVKDRPSTLERDGRPADVDAFMPLVLINPQITPAGPPVPGAEGCLSFPEIFEEISRPEFIEVAALNRDGQTFSFKAGGLLARAIQHEVDHLNGILFIDRMSSKDKQALKPTLEELQAATKAALSRKGEGAK
jgi:peptide deformylase